MLQRIEFLLRIRDVKPLVMRGSVKRTMWMYFGRVDVGFDAHKQNLLQLTREYTSGIGYPKGFNVLPLIIYCLCYNFTKALEIL